MQHARVIEVGDKMVVKPGVMAIFEFAFAAIVNGCFVDDAAAAALLACLLAVGCCGWGQVPVPHGLRLAYGWLVLTR